MKYKIKKEIKEMSKKLYESTCIHDSGQKRICAACIEENIDWIVREAAFQSADLVIKKACRTYDYASDAVKEIYEA